MAVTRVLVVSDSHLSQRTPEAIRNWRAIAAYARDTRPDLIVHCGDITANAPDHPEDLLVAQRELGLAGSRVSTVAGNHDVGDAPYPGIDPDWRIRPEHLVAYTTELGLDRWSLDVPGWRLIGINAQVFGSGLREEGEQWRWLDTVVPRHRRVALFVHRPLVAPPGSDDTNPGRYVLPAARERLLAILAARPGSVAVSGHVHQFADHEAEGVRHVWTPSTWAVLPDRVQPLLGSKTVGAIDLGLAEDGTVTVDLRTPPGVTQQTLIDDIPDPYGLAIH